MGIVTKEVEVRTNSFNVEYYKSLGYQIPIKKASESYFKRYGKEYIYDFSKTITVKIEDLQEGSHVIVRVKCDMCKNNEIDVSFETYNRVVRKTGNYVCKECSAKKRQDTTMKRYGKPFAIQSEEIRNKMHKTNLERYGVKNYGETKECYKKIKQTCLEKYNVEHFAQSSEIKTKKCKTLYKNGTTPTSKQQLYIYNLYSKDNVTELNFPIKYYNADICFPEEKIYCEYSGGGHSLRVTLGSLTQEEFDHKEIIRNNVLRKEGYRKMEIISLNDKLPSDTILLQMLDISRNYFNTTQHSWITFDIDQSLMFNAENKDGVYFDFGELRTIKKEDISDVA